MAACRRVRRPRDKPVASVDAGERSGAVPSEGERRRRWWLAATLALLAALIVLAVAKLDAGTVTTSLAAANLALVALAAGFMASSFMARAESWFVVTRAAIPDARIGRATVRRGLLIGMATSTLAPARLGEAARAWIVARRIGDPREVLATVAGTVLSQTLMNLLALSILAAIALSSPALTHAHAASLAIAIALPVGLVTVLLAAPRVLSHVAHIAPGRGRAGATWVLRLLVQARRGLAAFRHPVVAAHATAFQLFAWTLQLGSCYAMILALHLNATANVAAAAAVLVAVNLTAILPVTPSNVGVFQAACIAALAPFGVAASRGLAYGILLQSVEVFCALAFGAPALLKEGISAADVRRGWHARTDRPGHRSS